MPMYTMPLDEGTTALLMQWLLLVSLIKGIRFYHLASKRMGGGNQMQLLSIISLQTVISLKPPPTKRKTNKPKNNPSPLSSVVVP